MRQVPLFKDCRNPGYGARLIGMCLVFGGALSVASPTWAASPQLVPHRAVYDMTLARAGSGAGISTLSGRMVFELTGDRCKGFRQKMRFVTRITNRRGKPSITDQRSSFVEESSGRTFRFETQQYRDARLTETIKGRATRNKSGDGLRINLNSPSNKKIAVDNTVVFPVEHSMRLLEAAQKGETLFTVDLYDGSEKGERVFSTTAAVGVKVDDGANALLNPVESAKSLDSLAAWPVALSYFKAGETRSDAVPVYELSFLFFENGVSRKLFIDYGSFAMRGQLVDLKIYPSGTCDR